MYKSVPKVDFLTSAITNIHLRECQSINCNCEELIQYKLLMKKNILQSVWGEACVKDSEEEDTCHYCMNVLLHKLSKVKGEDGHQTFTRPSQVSKLVLIYNPSVQSTSPQTSISIL